jgi:hypothetical protein
MSTQEHHTALRSHYLGANSMICHAYAVEGILQRYGYHKSRSPASVYDLYYTFTKHV